MQNSSVYQFACEELGFGTSEPTDIYHRPTGELFDKYEEFCDEANCKAVSRNRFSTEMCQTYNATIERIRLDYANGKRQARVFSIGGGYCDA